MGAENLDNEASAVFRQGTVIPAHPLALDEHRRLDERRMAALTRYYCEAGAGGSAAGVHTTLQLIHSSHAAAFGVRSVSLLAGRTPLSVLVTNFNTDGLNHREVETFLHEFGHALHGVLSRTRYASQGGTSVERDFVEAPSQMYEEWGRKLEPLRLLRRYCTGCPEIDEALVKRLHAARSFGRGILYGRQHLYAAYDMALFGEREADPMQTWIRMEGETPAGYVPGTQFPGTFGHLVGGYGAGYYGYMWSEVIALDMLSRFGRNLMNPAVGRRFRELILARGGEEPAKVMVREFLGRDPSPEAFFEEITGQRGN